MHKKRLLIAGTDESNLKVIREEVNRSGDYKTSYVSSASECFNKANSKNFDLILLEYDLVDGNGVEVVESLIAQGVFTPMVMIIGADEKARGIQAIRKGARDYIVMDEDYLTNLRALIGLPVPRRKMAVKARAGVGQPDEMDIWAVAGQELEDEEFVVDDDDIEEILPLKEEEPPGDPAIGSSTIDQLILFQELERILLDSIDEPLGILLERIAETGCQIFRFQRSAVSMLDEGHRVYSRRIAIGYGSSKTRNINDGKVPRNVIDQLFEDRYRIRMVYREGVERSVTDYFNVQRPERRTQARRAVNQWEEGDVAVVRLMGEQEETIGFISFDAPEDGMIGEHDLFRNLELFGQWTSYAIAHHHRVTTLERRTRRLKRLLVTSNIFKLKLSRQELFNEIVWAIKFSSDFNLVGLGLISRKTGNLELKAVACDDKIKQNRLLELQFPTKGLLEIFRDEYRFGKSYLVLKQEPVFQNLKQVYYGATLAMRRSEGSWPTWGLLLVPIRTMESRTIGILLADDYVGTGMPVDDDIQMLEIMSNQFGIAIDNRSLYTRALRRIREIGKDEGEPEPDFNENPTLAIKRMADRIFRKS
jgi:CheY-like chemotaxis protein